LIAFRQRGRGQEIESSSRIMNVGYWVLLCRRDPNGARQESYRKRTLAGLRGCVDYEYAT